MERMETIEKLITTAGKIAHENGHALIEPAHLLKAILRKDGPVRAFLEETLRKDYWYFVDWADIRIGQIEKTSIKSEAIPSNTTEAVLREARNYQSQMQLDEMDETCVLAALATPGVGFTFDQLKSLPLKSSEIVDNVTIAPPPPMRAR